LNEKEPEPQKTVKHRAEAIFTIFASNYKNTFIFNCLEIHDRHFPAKSLKSPDVRTSANFILWSPLASKIEIALNAIWRSWAKALVKEPCLP
jgi:hypothetical protein